MSTPLARSRITRAAAAISVTVSPLAPRAAGAAASRLVRPAPTQVRQITMWPPVESDADLAALAVMRPGEFEITVTTAMKGQPDDVVAHRLGDFVVAKRKPLLWGGRRVDE